MKIGDIVETINEERGEVIDILDEYVIVKKLDSEIYVTLMYARNLHVLV